MGHTVSFYIIKKITYLQNKLEETLAILVQTGKRINICYRVLFYIRAAGSFVCHNDPALDSISAMWAGELIIRNLGHDGKPGPYGHVPGAFSFAPNRAWKLDQVI